MPSITEMKTKSSFYLMLGINIINLLKNHFLKFKFNINGGILLYLDMTEYVNLFRLFNEEILVNSLDELITLSHLMQIKSEKLAEAIKGSFSIEFKKYAKQLFSQRVDLKNIDEIM